LGIKKNISFLWVCGILRSTSRKGKGTALCAAIREGIICKRHLFTGVTANVVQYLAFLFGEESMWKRKSWMHNSWQSGDLLIRGSTTIMKLIRASTTISFRAQL
jgi:hypothetical protein